MKKTTLLLCLFMASVLMPQSVWAQVVYPSAMLNDGVLTIQTDQAGTLTNDLVNGYKAANTIVLVGKFSSADLEVINQNNGFNQVTTVDMSNAMFESNNSTSNLYFMYNSGDPSHNSPTVGSKALSGGQLYQLSVTTAKSWNLTREPASLNDAQYFNDENTLLNSAGGYSQGKIGYCPSGEYRYYMMNVNKYWDTAADPGNVQNYANQYSTDNLPPTDSYNVNDYIKVPSAFNYYKMQITKQWNPIEISYSYNEVDWEENDRAQHLGYELGTCIRFAHYNYEYYKVFKGNDNNNQYVCLLNKLSDYTPTHSEQSYNTYQDAENDKWNRQNDEVVLVTNETFSYYQMVETREWITPVGDITGATVPSFGENERDNNKDGFENGAVIKFPTAYSIYQLKETRQWTDPTPTPNSNTVGDVIDASFPESEINNNTANWGDKNSIRFPIYKYYVLSETPNRSWEVVTYNDDEVQTIYHLFVDINARDNDNTAQNDEYAMVGATEYVYKSSGWSTDLTPEPDYSAIRFRHWSGTLTTAYLPNSVDGASCPVEVLQECSHLTKLYSNNQYAEVSVSGTTATVTAQSPGLLKTLLTPTLNATNYPANTVFQFTSGSELNADDIYALSADPAMYYVDLYDISTGSGSTIERAIAKIQEEDESDEDYAARPLGAIDRMRADNKQFKGLLLPGNPLYVGTTLIKDNEQNSDSRATCTEFVAYNNNTSTGMYIYSESTDNPDPTYEGRLNKVLSMMAVHSVAGATTSYFVSTNSPSLIPNVSTKLGSGKTIIETVNNEMVKVATNPSIYVTLANPGDFKSLVENTSIEETPNVQTLQFNGELCFADINAVNSFAAAGGPKVFDLKNATVSEECPYTLTEILVGLDDNDAVNGLAYTGIDYIILPAGMTKEGVDSIGPKAVKAVISSNVSSDEDHNLVAYVNVPGSLAEARCLATGSSNSTGFYPAVQGLAKVILAGNLNESDISTRNENGKGLDGEKGTITTIDVEKVVFYQTVTKTETVEGVETTTVSEEITGEIMNFNEAGFMNSGPEDNSTLLSNIILPTDSRMKTIPNGCFKNLKKMTSICVPYNYEHIKNDAFLGTSVSHITTTDYFNGALVDNGPLSYTFSANLRELGEKDVDGTFVFPHDMGVLEVYSLATQVPKCYDHVFPENINHGYGGQDQSKVYCRDRYYNNGEKPKSFAVLRYPSEESYNATSKAKEDSYTLMKQKYTDITRAYTKKDQTGAVDANGDPILWPTREEGERAYNQALANCIWDDWEVDYTGDGYAINATTKLSAAEVAERKASNGAEHIDFSDYIGWHKIVLTQATYVDPKEHVDDDSVKYYYVDAGWYTICIPFDLSYSQVVKMLGVPKSSGKVKSFLIENGKPSEITDDDLMPDIRQLQGVERTKGVGGADNTIYFRLTGNLLTKNEGNLNAGYLDFIDGTPKSCTANKDGEEDPTCLVGGRPYIIRAYKRAYKQQDGSYKEETIPSQNIGKLILTRFADEFEETASCVNNEGTCEQLKSYVYTFSDNKYIIINDQTQDGELTMKFAKPYENHKVQAVNGGTRDAGGLTFSEDGEHYKRYYYTMIGQFWEQALPQYSLYMSKGRWYRYTNTANNFKWAPYKCVIMATPEVDKEAIAKFTDDDLPDAEEVMDAIWKPSDPSTETKPTMPKILKEDVNPGGGFRDIKNCFFPMNMPGTVGLIPYPLKLTFKGRDDHDFDTPGHHQIGFPGNTRYIFMLDGDDEVVEYDENGNEVTAIATLDGVHQNNVGTTKVYNLSGQYVGSTTEGLSKGVYIVCGRKVVVE